MVLEIVVLGFVVLIVAPILFVSLFQRLSWPLTITVRR